MNGGGSFTVVERSYHSTQNGCRLATFEEATHGLETIKRQDLLKKWDRARLLDGWISGPGYEYQMGNDFTSCMGYMLLIQTQTSAEITSGDPYADVNLSERGKEVALFLCVDDWNYEVVYWLLNRWSKSKTMNLGDVIEGNIPFNNMAEFKEMNKMLGRVARRLGEEEGAVLEKAGMTKYSGRDSVKEVLSGMIKIVTEEEDIVEFIGDTGIRHFRSYEGDEYLLPEFVQTGDVPEAFWSFVCDTFAGYVVEVCALRSLQHIVNMKTKSRSEKNLMIATSILLYLSAYRSDIIHEPLAHRCSGNCAGKIISYAAEKAVGDSQRFSKMLKSNAMWKCYDETMCNYGVLNKLLIILAKGKYANFQPGVKIGGSVVEMLLKCSASVKARDQKGMTPLHYALEDRIDEVINVLMESPDITESLDLKDERGYTPVDIATANKDYDSTAKLLSKCQNPAAYLGKENQKQLLRYSLLNGSVDIVHKLFEKGIRLPAGDCDEDGKTVLHLAAMCDDESSAHNIISMQINQTPGNVENILAKQDRRGRTVLHEAALKGHLEVCELILEKIPKLIYVKDRDGRNPLYDAVKSEYIGTALHKKLFAAYLKNVGYENDLMDRRGLTPLHVAASQGKTQLVKTLISESKIKKKYLSRGDFQAQTALHKAAKHGHIDMVEILLEHGAHPLRERDNDGRTALHYAAQAEAGDKKKMAEMLLEKCALPEEKSLLLWAPAAGVGTADHNLRKDDPLHKFLVDEKKKILAGSTKDNLLQMAACMGDIEMTKELISKGYQIRDIEDDNWRKTLSSRDRANVERVSRQIEMIKEQGNDKPAMSDSLGRLDYAQGLAALFLNPYIKSPIAVGITGSWGMGKSSLMVQTEHILLTTVAQMALLESSKISSSASEFPGIKPYVLSKKGKRTCEHIYRHIKNGEGFSSNIFGILKDNICSRVKHSDMKKELEKFLNKYDSKYRKVFKSLAAMDSSDMFKTNAPRPKAYPSGKENVPAILTVRYNAWKYRNDTEALAGMAVEITQELEGIMTKAQWLNACWRNTWKKKKYTLWIEIFFPSLLALVLLSSLTWVAWVVFDNDKLKEWGKAKYAWPPAAIVIMAWTLTKSVMGILKPVSTQLMQYISFPDHTDKLGYQERVISDITFLKGEIGRKACWVFIVFGWLFTTFTVLWCLITESWVTSLLFHHRSLEKSIDAPKVAPASGSNLRIIVFVDDLDRCQDSVILQVLSAINLVLAVCEINVVMGMDKRLVQRAIIKKYGDVKANRSLRASQELADMYLQKIIQLQLDLPDPSGEESRRFLKGQLGVLENENKTLINSDRSSSSGEGENEGVQQITADQVEVKVQSPSELTETCPTKSPEPTEPPETEREAPSETDGDATITSSQQNPSSSILIRELLFVRYSQGEENAFLHFQGLATDCRKLPREWKRLLNYHRLVWYIFSLGKEAKNLAGWQVQLITWIFICWEWQENMNLVIEKWKEIVDLKAFESNDPSLLMIVEYLMEEHGEIPATSNEEDGPRTKEKLREAGGGVAKINNDEETKSSSMELEKLNENGEGKTLEITSREEIYMAKGTDDIENMENDTPKNLAKDKLHALEKSLAELKEELKELKELVSDELKKDIKELKKQVSDELKKDINEIKEQMVKKQSGKKEENMECKKMKLHNLENWKRMKSTLERYDVTMDGIQAFQRFRFYCIAGYLPRPAPHEETYQAVFTRAGFTRAAAPKIEFDYVPYPYIYNYNITNFSDENPNTCSLM